MYMKINNQIKSKSRVNKYGEVFTASREVSHMLDLVDQRSFMVETVLEPACGTGNFLIEALNRKLNNLNRKHLYDSRDYAKSLLQIVSTLYGVDIQEDNVKETRARLFETVLSVYRQKYHSDNQLLSNSVRFVLNHNIMVGNTLELKDNKGRPLKFAEWKMQPDGTILRRDYTMQEIMEHNGECNTGGRKTYKYHWVERMNDNDRKQTDQVKGTGSGTRRSLHQQAGSQRNARSCEARD